jgi:hypothetical protein
MSCEKYTDVINVYVMSEKNTDVVMSEKMYFSHDIYIQACVFFRHDSNIYNIIVFQTWHLNWW